MCLQISPVTKMPRWTVPTRNVSISQLPVLLSTFSRELISSFFSPSRILTLDHKVKGHKTWLSRLRSKWKPIQISRIPRCSQSERQNSGNCFSLSLLHGRVWNIQSGIVSAWSKWQLHLKMKDWFWNRRLYFWQTKQTSELRSKALDELGVGKKGRKKGRLNRKHSCSGV